MYHLHLYLFLSSLRRSSTHHFFCGRGGGGEGVESGITRPDPDLLSFFPHFRYCLSSRSVLLTKGLEQARCCFKGDTSIPSVSLKNSKKLKV